jgi:hypothetical protein
MKTISSKTTAGKFNGNEDCLMRWSKNKWVVVICSIVIFGVIGFTVWQWRSVSFYSRPSAIPDWFIYSGFGLAGLVACFGKIRAAGVLVFLTLLTHSLSVLFNF